MVLSVVTAEINVTEPDGGEFTTVTGCFTANLSQPRAVDHSFQFVLSDMSTATSLDFFPNISSPILTIPAGVIDSAYTTCIDVVIIGDNVPEPTEFVFYDVVPFLMSDSVVYPGRASRITITIFDNDDCKLCHQGLGLSLFMCMNT